MKRRSKTALGLLIPGIFLPATFVVLSHVLSADSPRSAGTPNVRPEHGPNDVPGERNAKSVSPVIASEPGGAPTVEDPGVAAIQPDLRAGLGRGILDLKPGLVSNPPESVTIEFRPPPGDKHAYEFFSQTCDEQGNIVKDGITSCLGTWTYEVIGTNEEKGSYTVRESVGGTQFSAGPKGKTYVRNIPPQLFEKEFTYARDGSLLRAEYQGRDVTAQFRNVPQLSFPQKPLQVGDSWVCGGDPNHAWKIEAHISGFARVGDHDCLVVAFDESHQLKTAQAGSPQVEGVVRRGNQYIDFRTMTWVRKEYVETTKSSAGTVSGWAVRHMIDP
jgi:hypothetical protein